MTGKREAALPETSSRTSRSDHDAIPHDRIMIRMSLSLVAIRPPITELVAGDDPTISVATRLIGCPFGVDQEHARGRTEPKLVAEGLVLRCHAEPG